MTTSLAQTDYSTILSDTITIDTSTMANITAASGSIGNVTLGNGTGSSYYYTAGAGGISMNTITISSGLTTSSIGGLNITDIGNLFREPVEFVDKMPDVSRINKMCEEYPGLKIAYEKFVTTYKLVKDHYDTPEDERPLP